VSICLLRHWEVQKWERTGRRPKCEDHLHVNFYKAIEMIMLDLAVGMGEKGALDDKRSLVLQDSNDRYWRKVPSGGAEVMQLSPIPRGSRDHPPIS
jgi:hypothetical protein